MIVEHRRHAPRVGQDGQHAATTQVLHQAPTGCHQAQGILQREDASKTGRRELTQAVSDHHGRTYAPAHPQPSQRVLDGERGRLRHGSLAECSCLRVPFAAIGIDQLQQVAPEDGAQDPGALVQCGLEHRLAAAQARPIPGCRAPWPGKRKATPASWLADSRSMTARPSARRKSFAASQLTRDDGTTVRHARAPDDQRPGDVGQADVAVRLEVVGELARLAVHGGGGLGAQCRTPGPGPAVRWPAGCRAAPPPARRGRWYRRAQRAHRGASRRSERFHGRSSVFTKKGLPAKSICGSADLEVDARGSARDAATARP